jgi:hypothetical protein
MYTSHNELHRNWKETETLLRDLYRIIPKSNSSQDRHTYKNSPHINAMYILK